MKEEIYISVDIEADGPIPGPHSMLSLGAAAYTERKELLGTFSVNLETLPGASAHLETAKWWITQPEAWAACRENQEDPGTAIRRFAGWVNAFRAQGYAPVCVGYPATFDFMFVYWYLIRFNGSSPFGFSALDIKSYAMGILRKRFRETTKKNMPKKWFDPLPHTHVAVDDAIEQGALFCNIYDRNRWS